MDNAVVNLFSKRVNKNLREDVIFSASWQGFKC